jgi:hypothetical protein
VDVGPAGEWLLDNFHVVVEPRASLCEMSVMASRLAHVEQWISDRALGAEDATARSTEPLALTQIIMAHSITSLRAITGVERDPHRVSRPVTSHM